MMWYAHFVVHEGEGLVALEYRDGPMVDGVDAVPRRGEHVSPLAVSDGSRL